MEPRSKLFGSRSQSSFTERKVWSMDKELPVDLLLEHEGEVAGAGLRLAELLILIDVGHDEDGHPGDQGQDEGERDDCEFERAEPDLPG